MKKIIYFLSLILSPIVNGQLYRTTPFILDNNGYFWSSPLTINYQKNVNQSTQAVFVKINEIRGLDTTQGGCSDYDSVYVKTSGVVYGNNFGQSNGRIQFSLIERRSDSILTCGIGLYKNNQNLPVSLNEGDSIVVVGLVTCFNGLSQINIDSVKVLKVGSNLVQPRIVNDLNEVSESYLVKMLNMEFLPTTWPSTPSGSGFTSKAFSGVPGTISYKEFDIRIDNDCDLFGQPVPQGKVDIVGLGGQFDSSIPRNSKYQLLPRRSSDITTAAPVELPLISFDTTNYTIDENSNLTIQIKSSIPVSSQISCLIIPQNITTTNSDYILQQPNLATFPTGTMTTSFGITIVNDGIEEGLENLLLKLKKTSDNCNIGSDSIVNISISGSLNTSKLYYKNFYFYKDGSDLKAKFPNDFMGEVYVYDSFGRLLLNLNGIEINQNFSKINNFSSSVFRVIITNNNNRIIKTLIK